MNYNKLYSKQEKNELIRYIMIVRKKRKAIISSFSQKPTRFLEVNESQLLVSLMTPQKIHPFIKKVFLYFIGPIKSDSVLLTRGQTFKGLHIPFAYFSERESIMYALSSYVHDYELREHRAWRIEALLDQAYCHDKTRDMSLFINGIMLFNSAIKKDFDLNKLTNAFVYFQEIDENSELHAVAQIFKATYYVLMHDFKKALDSIAKYKEVSDNLIYELFSEKISSYIPNGNNEAENIIYLDTLIKHAA